MKEFFKRLFCRHEWEIKTRITLDGDFETFYVEYQCKKCKSLVWGDRENN